MDSLSPQSTNQPVLCGTTITNTKNSSTAKTTYSARRPSAPPIVIHIVDPMEDLEAGIIVPATPRGLSGRDNHFPIVIAVPMGDDQDNHNDDDHAQNNTLSVTVTTAPPKPPPSHLTSPKWSLEESTPKFRKTLAVLCGGTALLCCATVGILVAKSFRDHDTTLLIMGEDNDGWR